MRLSSRESLLAVRTAKVASAKVASCGASPSDRLPVSIDGPLHKTRSSDDSNKFQYE